MQIIKQKYVRRGVTAYMYPNFIWINGQKYIDYSMTEAIRLYRQKFKN